MVYEIEENQIVYGGFNYPLIKPTDFDSWSNQEKDAFIKGVILTYVGATPVKEETITFSQEIYV